MHAYNYLRTHARSAASNAPYRKPLARQNPALFLGPPRSLCGFESAGEVSLIALTPVNLRSLNHLLALSLATPELDFECDFFVGK